jgi:hypothetical protein
MMGLIAVILGVCVRADQDQSRWAAGRLSLERKLSRRDRRSFRSSATMLVPAAGQGTGPNRLALQRADRNKD